MASFLKNLIDNAAKSVNDGIQTRVENGTFNRMAENVGSSVSYMAAGLSSLVDMAQRAFGKINGGQDSTTQAFDHAAANGAQPVPPPMPQQTTFNPQPADCDPDYQPGVKPVDELMQRIAYYYELDDDDISLYGMARLNAVTAVFFARCDGQYTRNEHDCVEGFKTMIYEYVGDMSVEDKEGAVLDHLFDQLEGPSFKEILAMTHRLLDGLKPEERPGALQGLDELIRRVIEAEPRNSSIEEDYYGAWHREFYGY